jgi:hypothetical protein
MGTPCVLLPPEDEEEAEVVVGEAGGWRKCCHDDLPLLPILLCLSEEDDLLPLEWIL